MKPNKRNNRKQQEVEARQDLAKEAHCSVNYAQKWPREPPHDMLADATERNDPTKPNNKMAQRATQKAALQVLR